MKYDKKCQTTAQHIELIYCIWCVEPKNTWLERLENLMESCSLAKLDAMGFPEDWKDELLSLRSRASGL